MTRLEHDGEPLAALVHDPRCSTSPSWSRRAAAAARLALENARLHAELRAQLAKVRESRARIVAAADDERRRIERDLHDGAQQRLVALALELRSAQRELGTVDPELEGAARVGGRRAPGGGQRAARARARRPPGDPRRGGLAPRARVARRAGPVPVDVEATTRAGSRRRSRRRPTSSRARRSRTSSSTPGVASDGQRAPARGRRARGGGRRTTASAAPQLTDGSGLRGLADRRRGARRTPHRREPARRRHERRGGDPVRVVIADDSVLLREGLARVLDRGRVRGRRAGRRRGRAAARRRRARAGRRDRRRPHAADPHRRGRPRGRGEIRAEHPGSRRARALAGGRGRHALELFSEQPAGFGYLLKDRVLDDRRLRRGGAAGRHAAARRSTPRSSRSSIGRRRDATRSRSSPRASARCSG